MKSSSSEPVFLDYSTRIRYFYKKYVLKLSFLIVITGRVPLISP